MAIFSSDTALVLIDFINDIVDPKGKLAAKGYARFHEKQGSLTVASDLLARARAKKWAIIHVRVGFSPDYSDSLRTIKNSLRAPRYSVEPKNSVPCASGIGGQSFTPIYYRCPMKQ